MKGFFMERENTNFGLVGSAIERTKAYHNSNTIARYDGILVPNTQQTLDHFAKKHNIEFGKSTDTLEDDSSEDESNEEIRRIFRFNPSIYNY